MSHDAAPDIPGLVYVKWLGSGGFADVFLYEQQMPRMPVAVKVVKSEGLTQAIREQFTDEADTMAQLGDHPYIVQIFRADVASDGRPYLVMKYYPPPNLALRTRRERFGIGQVLRIGIQLASAVETAHRAGITHRDIKPANILVSQYGEPGLTDFGIAGRGGREEDDSADVGVSVPWAAPEVLFGKSNGDQPSDIYSLAATLWQLLVGRSPFEVPGGNNTPEALVPRVRSTAAPCTGRADVPSSFERLLAGAMSKNPLQRPSSALEFARLLQAVERELGFAQTAIVVLDEQGNTTLVSKSGSGDSELVQDADLTRIRSLHQFQAEPQGPTSSQQGAVSGRIPSGSMPDTGLSSIPNQTGALPEPLLDSWVDDGTAGAARYLPVDEVAPRQPGSRPTRVRRTVLLVASAAVVVAAAAFIAVMAGWGLTDFSSKPPALAAQNAKRQPATTLPTRQQSAEVPTTASTEAPTTASTEVPATTSTQVPTTTSTQVPATTSTQVPATASTQVPDPERAAIVALNKQRATDLRRASLDGQWVAQLSSKYDGIVDPLQTSVSGSHTFHNVDILDEFQRLQRLYLGEADLILLLSTDYGLRHTASGRALWVTFALPSLSSASEVQSWCGTHFAPLTGQALLNACAARQLNAPS